MIKMELDRLHCGALNLYDTNIIKQGLMLVSINLNTKILNVYHTEVSVESAGMGYAGQLLASLIEYVKSEGLMILPLCPYVNGQFKKHPELYSDVWSR